MSIDTILSENLSLSEEGQGQPAVEEDSIFVLTSGQLREIIAEATRALNLRVEAMEDRIIQLEGDRGKIEDLAKDLVTLSENQLIQLRLIADLRKKEPGKTERSRAEKIEKYLQSRPDHKATFETLKGHLGIDNDRLGKVIRVLVSSGKCAIIRTLGDKRKRSLILLPK